MLSQLTSPLRDSDKLVFGSRCRYRERGEQAWDVFWIAFTRLQNEKGFVWLLVNPVSPVNFFVMSNSSRNMSG